MLEKKYFEDLWPPRMYTISVLLIISEVISKTTVTGINMCRSPNPW
jgi:hypothetical protein